MRPVPPQRGGPRADAGDTGEASCTDRHVEQSGTQHVSTSQLSASPVSTSHVSANSAHTNLADINHDSQEIGSANPGNAALVSAEQGHTDPDGPETERTADPAATPHSDPVHLVSLSQPAYALHLRGPAYLPAVLLWAFRAEFGDATAWRVIGHDSPDISANDFLFTTPQPQPVHDFALGALAAALATLSPCEAHHAHKQRNHPQRL